MTKRSDDADNSEAADFDDGMTTGERRRRKRRAGGMRVPSDNVPRRSSGGIPVPPSPEDPNLAMSIAFNFSSDASGPVPIAPDAAVTIPSLSNELSNVLDDASASDSLDEDVPDDFETVTREMAAVDLEALGLVAPSSLLGTDGKRTSSQFGSLARSSATSSATSSVTTVASLAASGVVLGPIPGMEPSFSASMAAVTDRMPAMAEPSGEMPVATLATSHEALLDGSFGHADDERISAADVDIDFSSDEKSVEIDVVLGDLDCGADTKHANARHDVAAIAGSDDLADSVELESASPPSSEDAEYAEYADDDGTRPFERISYRAETVALMDADVEVQELLESSAVSSAKSQSESDSESPADSATDPAADSAGDSAGDSPANSLVGAGIPQASEYSGTMPLADDDLAETRDSDSYAVVTAPLDEGAAGLVDSGEIEVELSADEPSVVVAGAVPARPTAVPPPIKPPPAPAPRKPAAAAAPDNRKAKRGKPWFEEVFDDDYLRTLPFLTPQATQAEARFVVEALGVAAGAQLLDVGCGYGRHAMELAARGFHVVGLDSSLPLLLRGADEAQRRGLTINFVQGDMRELDFDSQFDGAYCLFSTFGYFDDDTNKKTAANIARALKPGARVVFEVLNRDYVIADLPTRVWWEGEGCVVLEEVEFNYFSSRIQSNRSLVFDDGRQVEQAISVRAYSLHEFGKLLHSAGFRVVEVSGSVHSRGRFFGNESRHLIVVAERKAREPGTTVPPNDVRPA